MCTPGPFVFLICRVFEAGFLWRKDAGVTLLQPVDAKQAAEMIGWAAAQDHSVEIVAGGSKRALGRPPRADHRLDASKLVGIVDYDPAELVLAARPATPLAGINA